MTTLAEKGMISSKFLKRGKILAPQNDYSLKTNATISIWEEAIAPPLPPTDPSAQESSAILVRTKRILITVVP